MAKETPDRKPRGYGNFLDAMKKIVAVPKADVERAIKEGKRKRAKK